MKNDEVCDIRFLKHSMARFFPIYLGDKFTSLASRCLELMGMDDILFDLARPTGQMPIEIDGKPCIWMAWTGDNEMPGYLQLCLQSIRKYNEEDFNVMIITPKNITEFCPNLHPAYQFLSYNHRADYLRCVLLNTYGGIYLDMDTLCFKGIRHWYELLHQYDVVSYDGRPWRQVFGISIFGPTRRDSIFTTQWAARLKTRLDQRFSDLVAFRTRHPDPTKDCLRWAEIISEIVVPICRKLQICEALSFYRIGPKYIQAVTQLFTHKQLFAAGHLQIDSDLELLILNNALYPTAFKEIPKELVLQGDLGIISLLRRALVDP